MQPSTSIQPPPKPPKIPKDRPSEPPPKIQFAPQLPPLYFESGSQTQQHDFAYDHRENQNIQERNVSSIKEPSRPSPPIPQTWEDERSTVVLPPPPSRLPPLRQVNDQNTPNSGFRKDAGSFDPRETSKAQLKHPDRAAPPPPIVTNSGSNINATISVGQPGMSQLSRIPIDSGGITNDPQRAEINQSTGSALTKSHAVVITIPQQPNHMTNSEDQETNSSFYWHSPQSSTDTTLDRSPTVAKEDEIRDKMPQKETPNATSLGSGFYNASALGFGAPSDWEHFGDYGGEEIDDTDLYLRPKTVIEPSADTAELPVTKSPVEELTVQPLDSVLSTVLEESDRPATPEAPQETQVQERSNPERSSTSDQESTEHPENGEHHGLVEEIVEKQDRDISSATPESSTTIPLENVSAPNYTESVRRSENEVLQETIGSHDGQDLHDEHSQIPLPVDESANLLAPVLIMDETDGLSDVPELSENESDDGEAKKNVADGDWIRKESLEAVRDHSDQSQESGNDTEDGPTPSDDADIRYEEGTDSDRVVHANRPDLQRRGTNGPEDDGGEDIIISLQLPGLSEDEELDSNFLHPHENSAIGDSLQQPSRLEIPMQEFTDQDRPKRLSVFPPSIEMTDPYSNLDPWAKASLNRYVKMLREEAQALKDEEKYMVFMNFTRRESRLRAILYDVDDEPEPVDHVVKRTPLKESTSILTLRPSLRSKALPALPMDVIEDIDLPLKTAPMAMGVHSASKEKLKGGFENEVRRQGEKNKSPQPGVSQDQSFGRQCSTDETHAMVDSPISEHHAPGNSIIPQVSEKERSSPLKVTPSLTSLRNAIDNVARQANAAFGNSNTSHAGKDKVLSDAQRSNSVPPVSSSGAGKESISSATDRPAYTPFRYNEGRPYEGDKATNRQSIYRPFSMSLRPGSIKSVETDNADGPANQQDNAGMEHDENQIKSENNAHQRPLKMEAKDEKLWQTTTDLPANQRNSILGPLYMVIPRTNILYPEPEPITSLKHAIDTVPDEFGFIHQAVLAWDAEAKHNRERYDRERNARQGENEQRIDALFHDNEIGYGDISELESEFKRTEAAKKADEDRAEFQSFVSQVFDTVWSRLHYEMDQLMPIYQTCVRLVEDASAGRDMFEDPDDRVPMALAMENLLALYQKLAIRHLKAFEAVLERDRRLKSTEVAPWYALGNIQQVKRIKRRFEEAEKTAILDFCRRRDERANSLMDVLDQNTLRGVGTNQDYMESVMQGVRKIAMEVALGAVMEDQVIPTDEVLKAKTITTQLARSSEQIVQTFHVADMLLNEADYEVSVANARVANADMASLKQLQNSKEKEDQKLVKDLEHRLSLIRGDTSRTLDEIMKLLSLLRSNGGESTPPRSTSAPADPEHEVRLYMALEEAKRRNAQKEAETTDPVP